MSIKRKGESGSPCLRPLEGVKISEGKPFTRIEKLVEVTKAIIHPIQSWSDPKAERTFLI